MQSSIKVLGSIRALAVMALGAVLAIAAGPANAQDNEYVRICDVYGTGFFYIPGTETCLRIGGQVRIGAGWGESQYQAGFEHDLSGGQIGAALSLRGYNPNGWMFGFDVAHNFANIDGGENGSVLRTHINNITALEVIAGYSFSRGLTGNRAAGGLYFFGLAGLAFGDIEITAPGTSESKTQTGYTLGVGVEYDVTRSFTLGARLQYYNFGSSTFDLGAPERVKTDAMTARVVGTWWFNSSVPSYSRMR